MVRTTLCSSLGPQRKKKSTVNTSSSRLDVDIFSLTILSHLPFHYFLTTFYGISFRTSALCLLADVAAIELPFFLLRARAPVHNPNAPKAAVPNRNLINDLPVRAVTTLLAAAIYSVIIYGSFATWLPVHLAVHFDGLRSLEKAHGAALPALMLTFVPLGYAARDFLFSSSEGAQKSLGDIRAEAFNPATASLAQTVRHNLWGWDKRVRVLIQRTLTLASLSAANTFVRTYSVIEGSEAWGAAGWAAVWAVASLVTGAVFAWVEEP